MLGDEIAEEPGQDTIKSYVHEIALDLINAAKSMGWLKYHTQTDTTQANTSQDFEEQALGALADTLVTSQPQELQTPTAVLGRDLTVVERQLLEQVHICGSAKRAVDTLAEARSGLLLEAFKARAFPSQPLAKRFAIVLAGPFANILFAPLLMILVFMIGVPTLLPVIGKVRQDMPAFLAGLRQGDRVTAVNGKEIKSWDDLSDAVKASGGAPLQLAVARPPDHSLTRLTVIPKRLPEETIYGNKIPTWVIGVSPRGDKVMLSYGPLGAIRAGSIQTAQLMATLC